MRSAALCPEGRLTCVYPQMDLQVVGGAEALPTVGAVLHGRAHAALPVLGCGGLRGPCALCQVVSHICNNTKAGKCWEGGVERWRDKKLVFSVTSNQQCVKEKKRGGGFFFPLSPFLCLPPFCHPNLPTPHKVKHFNGFTCAAIFPQPFAADRTLTVHKLSALFGDVGSDPPLPPVPPFLHLNVLSTLSSSPG